MGLFTRTRPIDAGGAADLLAARSVVVLRSSAQLEEGSLTRRTP